MLSTPGGSASSPLVAHFAAAGDVSSPGAMQLFGMLSSLLKVCSSGITAAGSTAVAGSAASPAAAAERMLAVGIAITARQPVSTVVGAAVCSMLMAALDKSSSSDQGESSSSSAGRSASTAALPWLVLLGRCCAACAVLVQYWQGSDESAASGSLSSYRQPQQTVQEGVTLVNHLLLLQDGLAAVVQWLAAPDTAALGYQVQDMQQQLAEAAGGLSKGLADLTGAAAASAHMTAEEKAAAASAVYEGVQQQLQAASSVLACFAISHACNNPSCSNLCGPSEARLVSGRTCNCSGCRTARYCGKVCQRAAWRQHKPVCKALATAAAAAAESGVAEPAAESDGRVAK